MSRRREPVTSARRELKRLEKRALEAEKNGQWTDAAHAWTALAAATTDGPTIAGACISAAEACRRANKPAQALALLDRAVQFPIPKHLASRCRARWVACRMELGRSELMDDGNLLVDQPDALIWDCRISLQQLHGDKDTWRPWIEELAAVDSSGLAGPLRTAQVLRLDGKLQQSLDVLVKMESEPSLPEVASAAIAGEMGESYGLMGDYAAAERHLEAALVHHQRGNRVRLAARSLAAHARWATLAKQKVELGQLQQALSFAKSRQLALLEWDLQLSISVVQEDVQGMLAVAESCLDREIPLMAGRALLSASLAGGGRPYALRATTLLRDDVPRRTQALSLLKG